MEELKNLKLLYVEDEKNIRQNAMPYFKRCFSEVYEASNAFDALSIFKKRQVDIVISDIKMAKMSGLELAKQIRKIDKKCQIILLTAHINQEYLLLAVELNLVKYLLKPLNEEKLEEAFKICIENLTLNNTNLLYLNKTCYFDFFAKKVVEKKEEIKLTKTQLSLLELLCKNKDRTVNFEEIENVVYYDSAMTHNALKQVVKKLRAKLPVNSIKTHSGIGYKLEYINK